MGKCVMIDFLIQILAGVVALVMGIVGMVRPTGPFAQKKWLAPTMILAGALLILLTTIRMALL